MNVEGLASSAGTGLTRRRVLRSGAALLGAAAGASLTGCTSERSERVTDPNALLGTLLGEPLAKPAAVLVDTSGAPFDLVADTADRLSLWFFGYTSCPDVCPVHLGVLASSLAKLRGRAAVTQVCFVGVDTRRDTPERLEEYLANFDERFIGLTGAPDLLDQTMAALDLPAPTFDEPDTSGAYAVGHASQILAFTADNLCHVVYPFGARRETWIHDLPLLVEGTWTGAPGSAGEGSE